MNKIKEANIKIKRDIISLARCNDLRDHFKSSIPARQVYCIERLRLEPTPCTLCIAMSAAGAHKGEIVLNREQTYRAQRFASHLRTFAAEMRSRSLIIAFPDGLYQTDAQRERFISELGVLVHLLSGDRITLKHVFSISGFCVDDYINGNCCYE